MAACVGGGVLGEETDDAATAGGAPHPEGACVRVFLMVEVAEVLVEGGPLFAEGEGEAGVKVVIGGDAVGDDLSFGEENVAGDLVDHNDLGVGVDVGEDWIPLMAHSGGVRVWATHCFRFAERNLAKSGRGFDGPWNWGMAVGA